MLALVRRGPSHHRARQSGAAAPRVTSRWSTPPWPGQYSPGSCSTRCSAGGGRTGAGGVGHRGVWVEGRLGGAPSPVAQDVPEPAFTKRTDTRRAEFILARAAAQVATENYRRRRPALHRARRAGAARHGRTASATSGLTKTRGSKYLPWTSKAVALSSAVGKSSVFEGAN